MPRKRWIWIPLTIAVVACLLMACGSSILFLWYQQGEGLELLERLAPSSKSLPGIKATLEAQPPKAISKQATTAMVRGIQIHLFLGTHPPVDTAWPQQIVTAAVVIIDSKRFSLQMRYERSCGVSLESQLTFSGAVMPNAQACRAEANCRQGRSVPGWLGMAWERTISLV